MMAKNWHKRIRSVKIHYDYCITGFSYFDKDGAIFWSVGNIWSTFADAVMIAENEVIVGVACKLVPSCQSAYTDF